MICFCGYVDTPKEKFIIFEVANMVELGTEFEGEKVLFLALLVASHFNKYFKSTQLKLKLFYNFFLDTSFLFTYFQRILYFQKKSQRIVQGIPSYTN